MLKKGDIPSNNKDCSRTQFAFSVTRRLGVKQRSHVVSTFPGFRINVSPYRRLLKKERHFLQRDFHLSEQVDAHGVVPHRKHRIQTMTGGHFSQLSSGWYVTVPSGCWQRNLFITGTRSLRAVGRKLKWASESPKGLFKTPTPEILSQWQGRNQTSCMSSKFSDGVDGATLCVHS